MISEYVNIDIIERSSQWQDESFCKIEHFLRCMSYLYKELEIDYKIEISLVLTDNTEIQSLNQRYRGKNNPTNVLSFPTDNKFNGKKIFYSEYLGDIVLSYSKILEESLNAGILMKNHCTHLFIHGVLHLLGYDHMNTREALIMESKETSILKNMGIADPYSARVRG